MSFPPLPLSRSLWMVSTRKWKVSIKKKPRLKQRVLEAAGCEGEGDGRGSGADKSSTLQQMEESRMVMIDKSLLDCTSCSQILKPPTFKCDAGHLVCQDCRASHVEVCTDAGYFTFIRCPEMDRMVHAAMASCVHKDRGCTGPVPYQELADHLRSCRFAPSYDMDSGNTIDMASAPSSPTTAPTTRPKRDRKPNPWYAGPSWAT